MGNQPGSIQSLATVDNQSKLKLAFAKFDADNSGTIDKNEWRGLAKVIYEDKASYGLDNVCDLIG